MTKTMEINELISELKEYNEEMTVKVWSNGANKDYPISHVGQGHTDGELDTYVSIVVDDDDSLVDLSKIWHDVSEEPIEYPILCKDELNNIWTELSLTNYVEGWAVYVELNDMSQWAYINDLLPKGGAK